MSAAAVMGGVWFAALALIPTRQNVVESGWWNFDLRAGEMFCLVVLVSVVIAAVFKRRVAKAHTLYQHAALAVGSPLVGAVLFTWGLVGLGVLIGRGYQGSVGQIIGWLVFLPPIALGATIVYFPVTLPLGVVSQVLMYRLAISRRNSSDKAT